MGNRLRLGCGLSMTRPGSPYGSKFRDEAPTQKPPENACRGGTPIHHTWHARLWAHQLDMFVTADHNIKLHFRIDGQLHINGTNGKLLIFPDV